MGRTSEKSEDAGLCALARAPAKCAGSPGPTVGEKAELELFQQGLNFDGELPGVVGSNLQGLCFGEIRLYRGGIAIVEIPAILNGQQAVLPRGDIGEDEGAVAVGLIHAQIGVHIFGGLWKQQYQHPIDGAGVENGCAGNLGNAGTYCNGELDVARTGNDEAVAGGTGAGSADFLDVFR